MWRRFALTFLVLAAVIAGPGRPAVGADPDQAVIGLVLGATSGALMGQAIGRDTEATLLGTAVGGVLGYVLGNEADKGSWQPATVQRHWNGRQAGRWRAPDWRRHWPHHRQHHERCEQPRQRPCREAEILATVAGRAEIVTATVCQAPDGRWRIRPERRNGHGPATWQRTAWWPPEDSDWDRHDRHHHHHHH